MPEGYMQIFWTALLGGSGAVGLLTWCVKRGIESGVERRAQEAKKKEESRMAIQQLIEHSEAVDKRLEAMAEENTLQCYCLLSCLRGLEELNCDGPVHDGINRLEKYLNKTAHETTT